MTIFKKIIDGEIPADVVHEDELCLAFRDISPKAPVHVLVIPKKEIATVDDIADEDAALIGHLWLVIRDIARKNPDMVEPVEMMAEGALELCTGRHVGRVVYSRDIVHETGRKVRSLDAREVLGDAFMEADVEATA